MVVVAAVDGEPGSERVIEEGGKLAAAFEEPLRVVFVYEEASHIALANEYMDVVENPSEAEATELAAEVIDDLAAGLSVEYEPVGRVGDPPEEILADAGEVEASYVVIGGRSQSPVGKALFGSVTQSVLLDAERPVVSVMNP